MKSSSTERRRRTNKRSTKRPAKSASTASARKTKKASGSRTSKKSAKRANGALNGAAMELNADDGRGRKPLHECAEQALRGYFSTINGHEVAGLYDLVLGEVERPLLRTVLEHTGGNQTRAAEVLGINRGTLRKKLRLYQLD